MSLFVSSAHASDDTSSYRYPLATNNVVSKFVHPVTFYSPGHRGVDFAAVKGAKVYAVADGRVTFAGIVANGLHVSIDHGNNIVSTSTYLATKSVRVGQSVTKGQLIGTTSGGGPTDAPNTFHFSVRVSGTYVDPISFLNKHSKPRDIYLAPVKTENTSLWQKILSTEKSAVQDLLKPYKDVLERFDDVVKSLPDKAQRAVDDVYEIMDEMKVLAQRIASDIASGARDAAREGMKQLKKLEKKLIATSIKTFRELAKYSAEYLRLYKKALSYGVEAGKWFLTQFAKDIWLIRQLAIDLALGLVDFADSAVTMSLKLLDQYVEIDVPMLLRAVVLPGSCLLQACTNPIQMKCNPMKSFTVKKASNYKGSGNKAFIVSGLNTSNTLNGKFKKPTEVDYETLGYEKSDVTYYSYAGTNKSFDEEDTYKDLKISARLMDEQIKEFARKNPGEKLDIFTHSLGGAVTGLWIALYYDPYDKSYPQFGTVVMYAPPLAGTSLSTAANHISSNDDGEVFRDSFNVINPSANAESVQQVAEEGEVAEIMNKKDATKKLKVYAIRDPSDIIVSAASKPVDGVEEIIVNEHVVEPHSYIHPLVGFGQEGIDHAGAHNDIMTNKKSLSTVQSLLVGEKPPCENLGKAAQSVLRASFVHATEVTIGRGAGNIADYADVKDSEPFINSFSG